MQVQARARQDVRVQARMEQYTVGYRLVGLEEGSWLEQGQVVEEALHGQAEGDGVGQVVWQLSLDRTLALLAQKPSMQAEQLRGQAR